MLSRLLTLFVLLAAAWFLYRFALEQDELAVVTNERGLLYPGLDPAGISELYVKLGSGQDLQFEREPGGFWEITAPGHEIARQERVAVVIDNLTRAEILPVELEGSTLDLGAIGLDPPRHVIRFGDGRHTETLLLGDLEPFGKALYARRAGQPGVFTVGRNLTTLLQDHAGVWVDPGLFRGLVGRVTRVRIDRPDGVLLDARWDGASWSLTEPRAVMADGERIARLARALRFAEQSRVSTSQVSPAVLHAHGLPSRSEAEAGEYLGATRIALEGEGHQAPVVAYLGSDFMERTPEVAAVRGDFSKIVLVDRGPLAMVDNDPDFFRAHRLFPPIRDRAQAVRVERDGELLYDVRGNRDGGWSFFGPERVAGEPVENRRARGRSPLRDLLDRIEDTEAAGFVAARPTGEPTARLSVTWEQSGRPRTEQVELWPRVGDHVPAVCSERPSEVLLLDPADVASLLDPFTVEQLRSLTPVSASVEDWAALELVVPGAPEPFRLTHDGQDWQGDDGLQRRRAVGYDLLESGFGGLAWEPAPADASYPYRITLRRADGELLADVELRRPGPDEEAEAFGTPAARARVAGRPGVELVVPAAPWVDRLDGLLGAPTRTEPGQGTIEFETLGEGR